MDAKKKYGILFKVILLTSIMCGFSIDIASSQDNSTLEILNRSLVQAVKKGDIVEVEELLPKGADANSKDDRGSTVLMIALISHQFEILELLEQYGARDENVIIQKFTIQQNEKGEDVYIPQQ